MIDLSADWLGLPLKNPIVASASPLTENLDTILRLEDLGAAGIVMHSLFEEQIQIESQTLDRHLSETSESYAEALSYFPDMSGYNLGPDGYVEHLRRAKQRVGIPIIGSLNGISSGGWISYAKKIEDAGADALELNVYFLPTDVEMSGAEVEQMYVELVRDIVRTVKIPVAVKLGPFFSAPLHASRQIAAAGARGLTIFNRFYQPDFDLEHLEVVSHVRLSHSDELRLRLRWVAIMYGRLDADMAITGGVHDAIDVLKCMMAGANVAMMTSALLRHGVEHLPRTLAELREWMDRHEYESIQQMKGSMSQRNVSQPAAFERAQYLRALRSYPQHGTSPVWPRSV